MGYVDPIINLEEAKKVFWGNDGKEKASYAAMIGRTMIGVREKSQQNLGQIMELLIECVIVEKDEYAKEEMFMALKDLVGFNYKK